jgi:hypothetical protein|tara:strand:- start:2393 stop:2662 length:270 start_codon:yes stop_codon:yes gene_type:complete
MEGIKMNSDILNALADALMGAGSIGDDETPKKWFVCVSDGCGGFKKHETKSLTQAQMTARDWSASGWPAWIQDEDGNPVVIAAKAPGTN